VFVDALVACLVCLVACLLGGRGCGRGVRCLLVGVLVRWLVCDRACSPVDVWWWRVSLTRRSVTLGVVGVVVVVRSQLPHRSSLFGRFGRFGECLSKG